MKTSVIISRLKKRGFKVVRNFNGTVTATKGMQAYNAKSYNALYRLIYPI